MTTGYCTFVYAEKVPSSTTIATTTQNPSPPSPPQPPSPEEPPPLVVTHNPAPPPLTEQERSAISADYIGETVFSKRFVLSVLLKLYKHDEDELYDDLSLSNPVETPGDNERQLTTKVESDVCELWDSSTNSDVAKFIFENQGKDVFVNVLSKTSSPRLMEICFGVLGNLACVDTVNEQLSRDDGFRDAILGYLSITDALSLIELTRFLNLCISNTTSLPLWMTTFRKNSLSVEQLITILENSLNVRLLEHVIQIIDVLFDTDSELMDEQANATLFRAVIESYQVIREKKQELVSDLLYILQLVSTTEIGVEQLAADTSVFLLLRQCVHDEQNVFAEKRPSLLVSVYSILGCLLYAKPLEITKLVDQNTNILEHLITILSDRIQEMATAELEEQQQCSSYDGEIYVPVYLEVFHDVCHVISTRNEDGCNFDNILDCLRSCEVQLHCVFQILAKDDFPDEWKRYLNNLCVLNEKHGILQFSLQSC